MALHGWGRSRSDLAQVIAGRNALLPDLPGFGISPPPPQVWGAADYASQLGQLIDDRGALPHLVVGHSFGGRVATCLAASRPDLVLGLVLIGAPLLRAEKQQTPPLRYRVARAASKAGLLTESRMERMRQRRGSDDYRSAEGIMRDVLVRTVNEGYDQELRGLTCPVALCWGELDSAVPASVAERVGRLIDNLVVLRLVEGASHDVHYSSPEVVREVLDQVSAAARC